MFICRGLDQPKIDLKQRLRPLPLVSALKRVLIWDFSDESSESELVKQDKSFQRAEALVDGLRLKFGLFQAIQQCISSSSLELSSASADDSVKVKARAPAPAVAVSEVANAKEKRRERRSQKFSLARNRVDEFKELMKKCFDENGLFLFSSLFSGQETDTASGDAASNPSKFQKKDDSTKSARTQSVSSKISDIIQTPSAGSTVKSRKRPIVYEDDHIQLNKVTRYESLPIKMEIGSGKMCFAILKY